MKTKSILAALLLLVAGVQTARAQKMTVNLTNGKTVVYKISQVESVTFDDGTTPNYEYVDLGLPSGTLWATFNVGATSPEEYGDYFAWGETEPKSSYSWDTYKWWYSNNVFTKYNETDGKRVLDPEDDAATVNWGSEWKMPSVGQFGELIDESYTTTEMTTQNGVNGYKVTSKTNGKSIFLPAAGAMGDEEVYDDGEEAWFWTSTIYNGDYKDIGFAAYIGNYITSGYRRFGLPVRPVSSAKTNPILVESIELYQTSLTLKENETAALWITNILPYYADNTEVAWESSDESVVKVSSEGEVTAIAAGSCTITCRATDGGGAKAECQVTVEDTDSHEYVDLGLPSGTLWATCNVGANSPEEYGDYFAWGETEPKGDYSWSSYKWMTEGQASWEWINKYTFADNQKTASWYDGDTFIGDGKKVLLPADDAATANWGSDWQTPSQEQCEELIANTTTTWTTQNGVAGMKITGKNGNSIFLPAGGSMNGTNLMNDGVNGQYWSRSLYTTYADYGYNMLASSSGLGMAGLSRYYGYCVRPVRVKEEHEYVDLGLPSGTLWATCNVGANSPEEAGDYFAWGETEPKENYTESTYTFSIGSATELPEKNDAATANWGSKWQMPSYDQCYELSKNTTAEWTTLNGASGLKVTGNNGNSIFLPTTGYMYGNAVNYSDTNVEYWMRSRSEYDDDRACRLLMKNASFNNVWSAAYNYSNYFYYGLTVRAVRK